ncbi:MAG: GNAT family N-acetyltransferase [Chitinophagaceae bacterium]
MNMAPLFCKPQTASDKILYSKFYDEINGTIEFRSLILKKDLQIIYQWVNMDYTLEYWQMNGHFSQLFAIYQCMELNPYSHSFIGLFNNKTICQYDVYSVFADELKEHIMTSPEECGFHLLMSPNQHQITGLTKHVVTSFLEYYFSFPEAKKMYAEPDVNNHKSITLLEKCGFEKVKTVQMSYKSAHIYCFKINS